MPREKGATSRHEAGKKAWETMRAMAEATLENLIAAGLIKPPLQLERDYKGAHVTAIIEQNGKVVFAGEAYDSLSTAAGMARKSVLAPRRTARILRRMVGSFGNTATSKAGCTRSKSSEAIS